MKEIYKGYTIAIEQDANAENPREENDNLGTMALEWDEMAGLAGESAS